MVKKVIYWILAMLLCSLSLAICTKANIGLSMIGAMPYILHIFVCQYFSWFTQGVAEYVIETLLIIITIIIVRRFKVSYLLSFLVAIAMGLLIDGWLYLLGGDGQYEGMVLRIAMFALGTAVCSFAIALFFRTPLPKQAYELTVVEIADKFNFKQSTVKYVFDISFLIIDVALTLILNHAFIGIGIGTIVITIVNAPLIKLFGKIIDFFEKKFSRNKETKK